jgi:predicted MPP superfamily phosphohydrolase
LRFCVLLLALYGAAFVYGYFVEPYWIETTRTEIRTRQPVLGQDRFRIVHLSDLHSMDFGRRERRIGEIVREARPDLILITGDYVNHESGYAALAEMFRSFHVPQGIYGVCGNNDSAPRILELLEPALTKFLQDSAVTISKEGRRLSLVGQSESSTIPLRTLLRGIPDDATTIYLSHKPDSVDELSGLDAGQRVDLFLCGHTHGGQICLPFWGAVVTESKHHKRYERGLYQVNGVPMYVNRGIGTTLFPIRFLARPEVAIIDLLSR